MATTAYIHKFSTGEISAAGLARIDQERTRLAAETQENLFPHVIGKGLARPGIGYLGGSYVNAKARILPFARSNTETALLEMTDGTLRIWRGDAIITRAAVTSTVTNGDFSASGGWTLTTTGDAIADINTTFLDQLAMACPNRGSTASCERSVATASAGTEHALRISVTRGPVTFRCGSVSGSDNYIKESSLDTGTHSLAFIPSTATYYINFSTQRETYVIVNSIQVESGDVTFTAPWSEDDLPLIRFDQSGDIVFLACESFQQRKVERRSNRSWSLVRYTSDDGPFTTSRTAQVKLKPGATYGNTTLTANGRFFQQDHIGALMYLNHTSMVQACGLGAEDNYTDGFSVFGVGADTNFDITVSGTWVGTLTIQRSYDGVDSGFIDTATTIAVNGTTTFTPGASYDNVIHYYRIGFNTGDYTSGSAVVTITYKGVGGAGICRILSVPSTTVANVEILTNFKNTEYTDDWLEGDWSDERGWPSSVRFYDGRLWWAGYDKFWGSVSDEYYQYNLTTEGNSGSIQRNVATGGSVNRVNWMLPLQRLIFGTSGSEVSARSNSDDGSLIPTSITLKDASTQGSAPISPVKMDTRGVFIHRDTQSSWEVVYDFESNDYRSSDLTRLNEDIGSEGFTELAIQRSPETYIWHVRTDGQCAVLLYDIQEQVAGWFRFVTDGVVESVAVLPSSGQDRVYMMVARTINGSTVRYLEKLARHQDCIGGATHLMADSYKTAAGPVSSITMAHLANETGLVMTGFLDGDLKVLTGLTANGLGVVNFGNLYTGVCCGLPYTWTWKSSKLAYGANGGSALLQPKRIPQAGLLLQNTHMDAIRLGDSIDNLFPMPRTHRGQALASDTIHVTYDDITWPVGGSWNTDSRMIVQGSAPYPATLLGLLISVETNEK